VFPSIALSLSLSLIGIWLFMVTEQIGFLIFLSLASLVLMIFILTNFRKTIERSVDFLKVSSDVVLKEKELMVTLRCS